MKKTTYRGCDEYEEYSPSKTIKVSEKEFWALKNAIADKIYNLNSVVARTDKKKRQHWVKQIQLLEDIRNRLKY